MHLRRPHCFHGAAADDKDGSIPPITGRAVRGPGEVRDQAEQRLDLAE